MAKSRNFKSHSIGKKNDMQLKSMLKEIRKMQIREVNKVKKYAVINENALNGILNSGVLPSNQSKVLKEYFDNKRIIRINESVIRRVDTDMKYISEGLIDFFKKAGDKATDAFVKGWTAVKAIWKNFSDVVKEFIEKIKQLFKKIQDWVMGKIKDLASKLASFVNEKFISNFKEEHPHEHSDLKKEFEQVKQTSSHLSAYFKSNLLEAAAFETKIMNGEVEPKGETEGVPEQDAQKAEDELKQESYNMYRSIFNNKKNLTELFNLKLTESGHLTDKIKNPIVRKIVDWCILILKTIMSPFSTAVSLVIKNVLKNTMKTVSQFCKSLQGPGVFEFAILTLLAAEIFEVGEDLLANVFHFKNLLSVVTPFLGPLAPFAEGLHLPIHLGHLAVGSYALFTVIYNLHSLFDKAAGEESGGEEGGGTEPEPQNAGYTPRGTFKIQEGNLIFVK